MQRLRNRASLFHARAQRFDAVPQLFTERAGAILVAHDSANGAFQSGEMLADAVVQVAADAPAFILLRADHSAGKISRGLFHALALGNIHHNARELLASRSKRDLLHVKVKPARVSIRLNHARVKLLLAAIAGCQRAALPHQLPIVGMRVFPEKVDLALPPLDPKTENIAS